MKEESKNVKERKKMPSLAEKFRALSDDDQLGVQHFFNVHNSAHWIYDHLTEDGKKYVTLCIRLNTQANKIEKDESAQES